jgi:hypothetical protein
MAVASWRLHGRCPTFVMALVMPSMRTKEFGYCRRLIDMCFCRDMPELVESRCESSNLVGAKMHSEKMERDDELHNENSIDLL